VRLRICRPSAAFPTCREYGYRTGWFAARPSGTENIYKICAESFKDQAHLDAILREAQWIVSAALTAGG
jgi:phosphoglucomutase